MWELSVGSILALLPRGADTFAPRFRTLIAGVGATSIVASAVWFDHTTPWPGYLALAPTLGAALVIYAGDLRESGRLGGVLSARPMVLIGGLSYSLYLWHWPFVVVGRDWLGLEGGIWGVALVTASAVPAWLSYRFVERPARTNLELQSRPVTTLAFGGALSTSVAVGGLSLPEQGNDASFTQAVSLYPKQGKVVADPSSVGAGVLGEQPRRSPAGIPRDHYDSITPSPARATQDVPRALRLGCQAGFEEDDPKWCDIGARDGHRTAAVVGDSKILQYFEALDMAGKAGNWRIVTMTKSACPFSEAETTVRGVQYEACRRFNENVFRDLDRLRPHAIITSQVANKGHTPGAAQKDSKQAMIAGLVSYWSRVQSLGIGVVVVLDNPAPKLRMPAYECLQQLAGNAKRCATPRSKSIGRSAFGVQQAAANQVPNTQTVDLTAYICPRETCAPVIGGVLLYRQGSHLTNTYVRTLAPVLARELLEALAAAKP
jgi:hypothetical protein